MRNPFASGVGGVLSADIAVPEHERELGFYAKTLTTGADPLWREDLMNNRGTPVIGLGPRSPEWESLPLQWMPHFQVSDVGASARRALELGGSELLHGRSEEGQSQWAVLVDPAGAAFGLIPVVDAGSVPTDAPETIGRIGWLTLVTPDVPSAREFYEQVVGWSTVADDDGEGFLLQRPDGGYTGAIRPASPADGEVPPLWLLGLPVGDLEESLRRVREGGGAIVQGSADAGYAVVRDPVGVFVALQAKGNR
jgi:predicted enzyme related to lactoylglutathione lyase